MFRNSFPTLLLFMALVLAACGGEEFDESQEFNVDQQALLFDCNDPAQALTCEAPANSKKRFVCHATASSANPFVKISVPIGNQTHVPGQAHGASLAADRAPGASSSGVESALDCNCAVRTCADVCTGAPDGEECDDADVCTGNGVCQGGVCQTGAASCTAGTPVDECTVQSGVCDPANGACLTVPANEGETCNDGDRCTIDSTCQAGLCQPGGFVAADDVYFTTDDGVYRWSSDTAVLTQISTFGSYAIALSPSGELFVGKGGHEAAASLSGTGIFRIDAQGAAQPFSSLAAEDLQFDPAGVLHAANDTGIYSLTSNGTATQRSSNPTSQFAFDSATTVVTTNGSAWSGVFGYSTDRIDLSTNSTALLNSDGGEDVQVLDNGRTLICGQSGLFDFTAANTFTPIAPSVGFAVFQFHLTESGNLYIGNADSYGGSQWNQGLYARPDGQPAAILQEAHDINALVVDTVCP